MKFRYFLCFSVSLKLTLADYCLDQANSSSLNDSFGEDLVHHNPRIIGCGEKIKFLNFKKWCLYLYPNMKQITLELILGWCTL